MTRLPITMETQRALSANPRSLFIYQPRSLETYSIHVLDSHNRTVFEILCRTVLRTFTLSIKRHVRIFDSK